MAVPFRNLISDNDLEMVRNALQLALEEYRKYARMFDELAPTLPTAEEAQTWPSDRPLPLIVREGAQALHSTHTQQAARVQDFLEDLGDHDHLAFVDEEEA